MSQFIIEKRWLSDKESLPDHATIARVKMLINGRTITEYGGKHDAPDDSIEVPAYYLADWIAENWWPLLWEPRKAEEVSEDEPDFFARHCMLTAQHGFVLPKVFVVPNGHYVTVSASARDAPYADVRFFNTASATLLRGEVESALRKFVSDVVGRLSEQGIAGTDLQSEWDLIESTDPDAVQFCQVMGALGLPPYDPENQITAAIDRASELLSSDALMDLCLASTPADFESTLRLSTQALRESAQEIDMNTLMRASVPAENLSVPGWRRGVNAAHAVRTALGIKETDPDGGYIFFQRIGIDPRQRVSNSALAPIGTEDAAQPVTGAVSRDRQFSRIGLLQRGAPQRRFTAARAVYAAWASASLQVSRLLTAAVTRDQQANRAFAAEMLAPFRYLRSHAVRSKLTFEKVFELADRLNVGVDVVKNQARNNGLSIVSSTSA